MKRVLGLDLGTNSIGWALIDDEEKKIFGMGSRIFPEGVIDLGKGQRELSKNGSRTADRGQRRQSYRRKIRRLYLLRLLSENDMCPLKVKNISISNSDIFNRPELIEWFKVNPYKLRSNAINKKIELNELGRVFYHMIHRRGFQSNSRSANNEEGIIFDGNINEGKTGVLETQKELETDTQQEKCILMNLKQFGKNKKSTIHN